jgi:hypothetical protein
MLGADAVLFTIDYPYEQTDAAVAAIEQTGLPAADKQKIASPTRGGSCVSELVLQTSSAPADREARLSRASHSRSRPAS